jgi:CubicO group peptidase (beta-lactamase class C family)
VRSDWSVSRKCDDCHLFGLLFTPVGDCAMKPEVDALMRNYTGEVPGAAVLVVRDRQAGLACKLGPRGAGNGHARHAETKYRLASVTKRFTPRVSNCWPPRCTADMGTARRAQMGQRVP